MRQPYVVPRRRLLFAVWLTVLALPILVLDNIPRTEAHAASVKTEVATVLTAPPSAAVDLAPAVTEAAPPSTEAAAATTATTAATTKPTTSPAQRTTETKPAEPRHDRASDDGRPGERGDGRRQLVRLQHGRVRPPHDPEGHGRHRDPDRYRGLGHVRGHRPRPVRLRAHHRSRSHDVRPAGVARGRRDPGSPDLVADSGA